MVALSIYKGNLHKVPDVPRKWLMPPSTLTVKDFKILLHRRSRALARLSSSSSTTPTPNDDDNYNEENEIIKSEIPKLDNEHPEEETKTAEDENDKDFDGDKLVEESDEFVDTKSHDEEVVEIEVKADEAPRSLQVDEEKDDDIDVNPNLEGEEKEREGEDFTKSPFSNNIDKKEEPVTDREKRRREVEEKLQILTEKKHSLVQVLKQILNAEEELKRRMVVRPSVCLQVDTTNDSASVSRLNTPRIGSEGNISNEIEGGETDHLYSRHLLRTISPSPSPDSQQRKSAFSAVQLTPRTNSGVANSPSRFALNVQQGQGHPSVSVSGTNYMTSSPSPVASVGTSAFKDPRISSPWN